MLFVVLSNKYILFLLYITQSYYICPPSVLICKLLYRFYDLHFKIPWPEFALFSLLSYSFYWDSYHILCTVHNTDVFIRKGELKPLREQSWVWSVELILQKLKCFSRRKWELKLNKGWGPAKNILTIYFSPALSWKRVCVQRKQEFSDRKQYN